MQFIWHPPIPHWLKGMLPWLTFCPAACPAFGAAMAGILNQGEFHRLSERSMAMSEWLNELAEHLDSPDYSLSSSSLRSDAETAANIMIAEHLDWRLLFKAKPIVLPS